MASPSATALWKAVVESENDRLEDPGLPRKWRIASNHRDECCICEEKGGVLIGCSSERCTKYAHLDCATQTEGLMLTEDGLFTFECDKHSKPPLFCSCKQKYDNSKEYIYCDSCHEWYHHTCQKVTAEEKNKTSYICTFCKDLLNAGKTISQDMKDGNTDKETKSNDMIRSEKFIGSYILPLILDVCPLIDSISGQSTDPIKISDIQAAVERLNSAVNNLSAIGFDDPADVELLQKLGVLDVFNQWLNICEDFVSRWTEWNQEIASVCSEIESSLQTGLWSKKGEVILECAKRQIGLEDERKASFKIIDDDLDSYQLFTECISWATEFLQVFFADPKPENWTQTIGSLSRNAQSKLLKKLNAFKKDQVALALQSWMRPMVQEVENVVNGISRWHNSVCTVIFGKDASWDIQEAERLMAESDAFPTVPPLRKDLQDTYNEALKIIDKFEEFLSSSVYEENVYSELMDEKDNIGLKLSFEDELDCIKEHGVFLKAYEMVSTDGRIRMSEAKLLISNAQSVEEDAVAIMKNEFPISQALYKQLHSVREDLERMVKEAEQFISSLNISSMEALSVDQLSTFAQLSIVTEEEEYLTFCKDADAAHARVEAILAKTQVTTLIELDEITDRIKALVDSDRIPDLESTRSRKSYLRTDLAQVTTMLQAANREWEKLASALEDAASGLAVSAEVVQGYVQQCRNTQIANDGLEQEALAKLREGESLGRECEQSLATLVTVDDETLKASEALVERVRTNFIAASIGTRMKLRYETMKTILSCQTLLKDSPGEAVSAAAVTKKLNDMRDAKMSLLRLTSSVQTDSLEASMIETVRDRFLHFQWTAEARDVLFSELKTPVMHAQRLLEETASMSADIQETPEYRQLSQAINVFQDLQTKAVTSKEAFQNMLQKFVIPPEHYQSQMDVDDSAAAQPPNRLLELTKKTQALAAIWVKEAGSLYQQVKEYQSVVEKARVMNEDIAETVTRTTRGMQVIQSIFSMFDVLENSLSDTSTDSKTLATMPAFDATLISDYQVTLKDTLPGDVPLVLELHRILDIVNFQVHRFVETYSNMVPVFFTRQRNRSDASFATKEVLISVLMEPIARAIRTPIHARLHQALAQISDLRSKITDFLVQPNQIKAIAVGDAATDEEQEAQLKNDLVTIETLLQESELIPLDLPETKVLAWLKELFEWIDRIPLPNTTDFEIDYEEAISCKKEAIPLIQEIPGSIIAELISMGVMATDDDGAPSGFVSDAHMRLQNVGDYFEHLEKQIGLADVFSLKVERILAGDAQPKDIEALLKEKDALVVLPSRSCLRMLERAQEVHKTKKNASAAAFVQQKVDKKNVLTSKMTEAAAAAAAPKKSSRLCASSGCTQTLRLPISSAFCSDTCAVKSIEELTKGILKYKTAIQAQKQAAAVGAQVSVSQFGHRTRIEDVKAFDLNPMKKSVEGIIAGATDDGKSPRASAVSNHALSDIMHRLPAVTHDILRLDKLKDKVAAAGQKDRSFRLTVRGALEDVFNATLGKLGTKAGVFQAAIMALEVEQGMFEKYDHATSGEYQKHFRMLNTNLKRPNNEYLIKRLAEGEMAVKELLSMSVKQFADQELQQQRELQKEAMAKSTIIELNLNDDRERRHREAMAGGAEAWRDRSDGGTSSGSAQFNSGLDPLMATPSFDSSMDVDLATPTDLSSPGSGGSFFRTGSDDESGSMSDLERRILDGNSSGGGAVKRALPDQDAVINIVKKPRTDAMSSPRRQSSNDGTSLLQRLKENSDLTRSTSGDSGDDADGVDVEGRDDDDEEATARRQQEALQRLIDEDQEKEKQKHPTASTPAPAAVKPVLAAPGLSAAAKANVSTTPSIRLVNKEGAEQFSIVRPHGGTIRASAIVSDKRVQGLVKGLLNIDGRTKIAELERFLGEVLAHGKKTVAVAVFLVPTDNAPAATSSSTSYQKFVEEFTAAERAGLCNASPAVQVYLIPPALQAAVSVIRDIRMDSFPRQPNKPAEFQHQVLFAVIVSKEVGPTQFTSRTYPPLLLAPNSFATTDIAKAAPALLPVPSAALPAGATFQRPSAFDSMSRPGGPAVPPAPTAVAAATAPVANSMPPAYLPPEREHMRQVAELCAKQGTHHLDELRSSPDNRFKMPFIYDGNPGYEEFKGMIIEFARQVAQQTASAATMGGGTTMAPQRAMQPTVPVGMPALRPPMAMPFNGLPQMQPRGALQPPAMGGFPRPGVMGGPRPGMPGQLPLPSPQGQQPPSYPGQQPPRRSRFA